MRNKLCELVSSAFGREALKRLVFSRPSSGEATRISCRLVAHRGRRFLAAEYSLPGNTVSQKNITEEGLVEFVLGASEVFDQVNLITALGDAEYKRSRGGREVLLGGDKLARRLEGAPADFERAVEELDRRKSYILSGNEKFLVSLGISSRDGRVHDKKQGKFRQINKFLEHIGEIYGRLPAEGTINVFDLCSGKSYLSFAVYHYLTEIKGREVYMLCVDLKRDVILWCEGLARELGYSGMHFLVEDVRRTPREVRPDMVISLHACDIATDVVIDTAIGLGAEVILSTPCCHSYMNGKVVAEELSFVTEYSHLGGKLCEALTDGLRVLRLRAAGYSVTVPELTDPENTPKNTLIRATRNGRIGEDEKNKYRKEYERTLRFLLGDGCGSYLEEIK